MSNTPPVIVYSLLHGIPVITLDMTTFEHIYFYVPADARQAFKPMLAHSTNDALIRQYGRNYQESPNK